VEVVAGTDVSKAELQGGEGGGRSVTPRTRPEHVYGMHEPSMRNKVFSNESCTDLEET
jgi:hypothetical protein